MEPIRMDFRRNHSTDVTALHVHWTLDSQMRFILACIGCVSVASVQLKTADRLSRLFRNVNVRALNAAALTKCRSNFDCLPSGTPLVGTILAPNSRMSRRNSLSVKCVVMPGPMISHNFWYWILIDHVSSSRISLPKRIWMSGVISSWEKNKKN